MKKHVYFSPFLQLPQREMTFPETIPRPPHGALFDHKPSANLRMVHLLAENLPPTSTWCTFWQQTLPQPPHGAPCGGLRRFEHFLRNCHFNTLFHYKLCFVSLGENMLHDR